jgi:hypothetical protein
MYYLQIAKFVGVDAIVIGVDAIVPDIENISSTFRAFYLFNSRVATVLPIFRP